MDWSTKLSFIALFLATAGCEKAPSKPEPTETRKWTELPDGSFFWRDKLTVNGETVYDNIERCWPIKGAFDCLVGSQSLGLTLSLTRIRKSDYTYETVKWHDALNGYLCQMQGTDVANESIYSNTELLTENAFPLPLSRGPTVRPWDTAYASQFIQHNVRDPEQLYFQCASILELIGQGSMATFGTTAIGYGDLL